MLLKLVGVSIVFFTAILVLISCNQRDPIIQVDGPLPNIILVSMDTLRADHLGCYGNPCPASPFVDALSRIGTTFSNVTVQGTYTLPSHVSILSGMTVSSHGVMAPFHHLNSKLPYLPEILDSEGYETVGFTGGGFISNGFGFQRGFDVFITPCRFFQTSVPMATQVVEQIVEMHRQPFFMFLHGYDVHTPFYSPPPFNELIPASSYPENLLDPAAIPADTYQEGNTNLGYYTARYDCSLRHADHYLQQLVRCVYENEIFKNTIFIILSDHGEELMDKGAFSHQFRSLYESNVAVPLVVVGPGIPGGKVITRPVRTIDIVPWILETVKIPVPAAVEGVNVMMDSPGETDEIRASEPRIFSENIVYNHLVFYPREEVFTGSTYARAGIIASRVQDVDLRTAIRREFGDIEGLITEKDDKTFVVNNHGSHYFQVRQCASDAIGGSYILFEWIGPVDEVERDFILQSHTCVSESPQKVPVDYNRVSFDGYAMLLPKGHKVLRDSNSVDIRMANWKLIYNYVTDQTELYDMEADPAELTNFASTHGDTVEIMKKTLSGKQYYKPDESGTNSVRSTVIEQIDDTTLNQLRELGYIGE